MKVRTLRRHSYDRKVRAPGDVYEIGNAKHVRVLEAVKRVERVPEKIEVPIKKKKTTPRKTNPRQYKRRDMFAEKDVSTPVKKVVKDARSDTDGKS